MPACSGRSRWWSAATATNHSAGWQDGWELGSKLMCRKNGNALLHGHFQPRPPKHPKFALSVVPSSAPCHPVPSGFQQASPPLTHLKMGGETSQVQQSIRLPVFLVAPTGGWQRRQHPPPTFSSIFATAPWRTQKASSVQPLHTAALQDTHLHSLRRSDGKVRACTRDAAADHPKTTHSQTSASERVGSAEGAAH